MTDYSQTPQERQFDRFITNAVIVLLMVLIWGIVCGLVYFWPRPWLDHPRYYSVGAWHRQEDGTWLVTYYSGKMFDSRESAMAEVRGYMKTPGLWAGFVLGPEGKRTDIVGVTDNLGKTTSKP